MLLKDIKYSYNDVMIIPSKVSNIEHRSECDPFHKDGYLPIFTAPMSTVVDLDNYQLFEDNHIHSILPRNISYDIRLEYALNNKWAAFSLKEFENFFCDEGYVKHYIKHKKKVLIDIANGHMKKLFVLAKKAKRLYGETLQLMIGNIANPKTYEEVLKCGADYVMIGSVFAQLIESAAKTFTINEETKEYTTYENDKDKIIEQDGIFIINDELIVGKLFKIFYGMASKEGQIDIFGEKTKTSEGIVKTLPCTTNVNKWVQNMIDYLRSTMSYTDINNVYHLDKVELILISDKTYNSINK